MPRSEPRQDTAILHLVEIARQKSDAFIVLGIMPGGRFFFSCDDKIALPDLQRAIEENTEAIIASVSRSRGRKAKEAR